MKDLVEYMIEDQDEQPINESGLLSAFDVSLANIIYWSFGAVTSIGFAVTGHMIRSLISKVSKNKNGHKRNELMLRLKKITDGIDMSDMPKAQAIMNKPGEWSSFEALELSDALKTKFSETDPNLIKEFEEIRAEWLEIKNKFDTI